MCRRERDAHGAPPPPVRSASESRDLEGIRWALLLYSVIVKNPRPHVAVCGFYVSFPARRTWSARIYNMFSLRSNWDAVVTTGSHRFFRSRHHQKLLRSLSHPYVTLI